MAKEFLSLEEFQEQVNNVYGKDEWEVLMYEGFKNPCLARHKCGKVRDFNQAHILRYMDIKCDCIKEDEGLKNFQNKIDEKYGKGELYVSDFKGINYPATFIHKCGNKITLSQAKSMLYSKKIICEKCEQNKKIQKFQDEIDGIYGEGQWKVLEFNGSLKPVKLQHKCGEIKTLTRASTVKKGVTLCDICKHEKI